MHICVYKNGLVDGFSLRKRITGILNCLLSISQCLDFYNKYVFLCDHMNPTASLSEASLLSHWCRQHQGCPMSIQDPGISHQISCCWKKALFHSFKASTAVTLLKRPPRRNTLMVSSCRQRRVPGAGSLKVCVMWGRPELQKI